MKPLWFLICLPYTHSPNRVPPPPHTAGDGAADGVSGKGRHHRNTQRSDLGPRLREPRRLSLQPAHVGHRQHSAASHPAVPIRPHLPRARQGRRGVGQEAGQAPGGTALPGAAGGEREGGTFERVNRECVSELVSE